jgi:DnaJ-class molecular chaperone
MMRTSMAVLRTETARPAKAAGTLLRLRSSTTGQVLDIRKAYLRLAKQSQPDANPDKPESEDRFKQISAAHSLLADAKQHSRFNRGEIDAS